MMKKNNLPIIFLYGPTATGKTDIAIALSKIFPFEIISVDSAMIYRDMNIGTNKPSLDLLTKYPHHLVDILDPKDSYSVNQFCHDCSQLIKEIHFRNHIPILVGGTMLYFHTLKHGISVLPAADLKVRHTLEHELITLGAENLHQQLAEVDKDLANKIHPNDPQRLLRALEIFRLTGKTPSSQFKDWQHFLPNENLIEIALTANDRAKLHERIETRFHDMLENGLVDEVTKLYKRNDLHLDLPSIRCVGYRQVWQYLEGDLNYNDMIEKSIIATRQLAKRQMTWIRQKFNPHLLLDYENKNNFELITQLLKASLPE